MNDISDNTRDLPKITLVVPSLNQGRFLRQCLDSILSQEYPDLELIVIDAGSTDESVDIIREYEEKLNYWVSEPDKGQSDGINKGFRKATGELVAWLNADDFYLPDALKRAAGAYLRSPGAPFYFGDGFRVNEEGEIKEGFFPEGQVVFHRQALLYGLNFILQPSTFINLNDLQKVGYLDVELSYGMDSDLWMKLSELGEPIPIEHHLSASREYPNTKTASGSFERAEELRRIAQRHTGKEMTPGALSYYLQTLHDFSLSNEDVFDADFRLLAMERFWREVQMLLGRYSARPNGYPDSRLLAKEERGRQLAKRIGIELRQVVMGVSGGIAPHIKGVLETLIRDNPEHEYYLYTTMFNRRLLNAEGPNVHRFTYQLDSFWDELDSHASQVELDVLFRPYPGTPLKRYPPAKQVVFIPDIQHEHLPQFFSSKDMSVRREIFAPVLRYAGAIGTNSEYVRQTLTDFPQTECQDIFLMPPAAQVTASDEENRVNEVFERRIADIGDYFFFPANLWRHKNHKRLLEAFEIFRKEGKQDIALILTGHFSGWEKLARRYRHLPVHHLGFVSRSELGYLYRHAVALTFFSLYEGFGMPLMEAFEFDCPVICSNTTSLPEVGGNAVLSCDPEAPAEMARLMAEVAGSEAVRRELVAAGKVRLAEFTWERSAQELMAALTRVAKTGKINRELPEEPLVSIVTPSFNQGKFLQRTIESVLNQTYSNIEYIVIDGGSTDESVEILAQYGDRFYWVSEPDGGQTDAINKGFRISNGQIRAYLNSDDTLLPHAIETIVHYFREHPECDMVYGDANYIDTEDRVTGKYKTADYSFERLMFDCCVCQPAAFWRTDIAYRVGPFNDELNFVMDYDYWLRIDRAGGVIQFLPEVLANSRLYPETKTLSERGKIHKEIFVVTKRHGGYVDLNYFFGYWHHLLLEKSPRISRVVQRIPKAYKLAAILHHKWFHRAYYLRFLYSGALVSFVRKRVASPMSKLRSSNRPPVRKSIQGYWGDGWLAPRVFISSRNIGSVSRLYLAGVAAKNTELRIVQGDILVKRAQLDAGQEASVEFETDQTSESIVLEFDNWKEDEMGRKLAFNLLETNLFTEEDLRA